MDYGPGAMQNILENLGDMPHIRLKVLEANLNMIQEQVRAALAKGTYPLNEPRDARQKLNAMAAHDPSGATSDYQDQGDDAGDVTLGYESE